MGKSPIGKRPIPKVAKTGNSTFHTGGGSFAGVRGSKKPTGSRPTPAVAKNNPNWNQTTNKVRQSPKHTPMSSPENAAAHSAKGRAHGGA